MTTDTQAQESQTFAEDIERVHGILDDRERDYYERHEEAVQLLGTLASEGRLEGFRTELRSSRSNEMNDGVAHWADLGVIVDNKVAEASASEEQ